MNPFENVEKNLGSNNFCSVMQQRTKKNEVEKISSHDLNPSSLVFIIWVWSADSFFLYYHYLLPVPSRWWAADTRNVLAIDHCCIILTCHSRKQDIRQTPNRYLIFNYGLCPINHFLIDRQKKKKLEDWILFSKHYLLHWANKCVYQFLKYTYLFIRCQYSSSSSR